MKGDWLAISVLTVIAGLMFQAIGVPVMPWLIGALKSWATAIPHPTEQLANIVGSLVWPVVILAIAWIIRFPLASAAGT